MNLIFLLEFCLSVFLVSIDLTSSESTSDLFRNQGNRIRRIRAQRERKFKREISDHQRIERQANPPSRSDPSYDFAFRTPEYQRRESADNIGRVRGLYSFLDDVGEKHVVRYAASADRGFEVFNAVPDASKYVQYSAPLYKTSPKVRGRVAYERGPGRQYSFISSGPDQRRTETIGPDGITRGAFSYLDDKGTQRTTQYIAGPGIGYRIVQDTTGPGTHLLPRPAGVEFGILYPRQTPNRGGGVNVAGGNENNGNDFDSGFNGNSNDGGPLTDGGPIGNGPAGSGPVGNGNVPLDRPLDRPLGNGPSDRPLGSNDNDGLGPYGGSNNGDNDNSIDNDDPSYGPTANAGNGPNTNRDGNYSPDSNRNGRPNNDKTNTDFPIRDRFGSTLITNSGDTYFGIAPGSSARAHVQNIDIRPYGDDGAISPSEALRRDERRALRLRGIRPRV